MMASELVQMLLQQIELHGDCEVRIDGEVCYSASTVYHDSERNSISIE